MISVPQVVEMQAHAVDRWHLEPIGNPFEGFLALACRQHAFNFQLWHEEDIARSPDVSDAEIAKVKRNIDRFNQQRNDAIEKLDDHIVSELARRGVRAQPGAALNTETPGSAIDRLSILALRIFHMREQLVRTDASPEHLASVRDKLEVILAQRDDLAQSLQELLGDIFSGRKRMRVYRQFKMYNDPSLNPYLYQRKAG